MDRVDFKQYLPTVTVSGKTTQKLPCQPESTCQKVRHAPTIKFNEAPFAKAQTFLSAPAAAVTT